MEWVKVSGRLEADADYVMLLARMQWLITQRREEARLLLIYGAPYLQDLHRRLRDMGCRPQLVQRERRYGHGKGSHEV